MTAPRDNLQRKWEESNRFANFGEAIVQLKIEGIRCHRLTVLDITSPITAVSGLNGTGKSTILQMLAVACANNLDPEYRVSDFMVLSALDPSPFAPYATLNFQFWQEDRKTRSLTISRNDSASRWYGYDRRKQRSVFFAGVGLYLPKIEKRDFVVRNASRISVLSSSDVVVTIKDWTCRVLGHAYDVVKTNTVSHATQKKSIASVTRRGNSYSETHMGFGEGRAQFMIQSLEALPDKSLVLIEEPETSLHQRAQHAFGQYLIDVCIRKGHQVFLTTHSQYLLSALHSQSRVFLYHGDNGIEALRGLAATQANSLLTEGYEKAITAVVEDECARALLAEIIRRIDPTFLPTVGIVVGGSAEDIARAARVLKHGPCRVAAVRDGDKGAAPADFIFKLPGTRPPEKEILMDANVQAKLKAHYGADIPDFLASNPGLDHHQWFSRLGERLTVAESTLVTESAREYAMQSLPLNEAKALVDQLKDAASK